ncbi:MAG: YdeI/OmpD-associated family protein [Oceanihabitans sp.]
MKKINSVEEYLESNAHFAEALQLLREIIITTELQESIKWSAPVYTLNGKNVIGIGAFKKHFGLWFFNGVFLKDTSKVLVNAQESTKALRQMRFNSIQEIDENMVLSYVKEAIENQKLGKEVKPDRKKKPVIVPDILQENFKTNKALQEAFNKLTPGKQREYCNHLETAKREATKQSRLEKIIPMVLQGVGLHDKYKNC